MAKKVAKKKTVQTDFMDRPIKPEKGSKAKVKAWKSTGFETVSSGVKYFKFDVKKNKVFEGRYLKSEERVNKLHKPKKGQKQDMQTTDYFKDAYGTTWGMPSNYAINKAVAEFGEGIYRFTFNGKQKGEGAKTYNDFKIEFQSE